MILKIGDEYYKLLLNNAEIKDSKVEFETLKMLKWIKVTTDVLEDCVVGDDMSYLDNCPSSRIQIYTKVALKFGYNLSFEVLKNQEAITIL